MFAARAHCGVPSILECPTLAAFGSDRKKMLSPDERPLLYPFVLHLSSFLLLCFIIIVWLLLDALFASTTKRRVIDKCGGDI